MIRYEDNDADRGSTLDIPRIVWAGDTIERLTFTVRLWRAFRHVLTVARELVVYTLLVAGMLGWVLVFAFFVLLTGGE